jgi:glycosyltransferase involved in cell wall biosynthesis
MVDWPKVSVITPSYNQARFLEETILSVLTQDYPNIEYIIIDGGSTDGSVEIIRKYANRLAYWVSEPDDGQSDAINKGLQHATGEIWAWMNSDDLYLPGAIQQAVEYLRAEPEVGVVYGDCSLIGANGEQLGGPPAQDFDLYTYVLHCNNYIPSGSTFIRSQVLRQIGNMDVDFHMIMDMDYWIRAGMHFAFGHINKPLSLYRTYPSAKTWNPALSTRKGLEIERMYEKMFSFQNLPDPIQKSRRKILSRAYLSAAYHTLIGGAKREFWRLFIKSILIGPTNLRGTHVRLLIQVLLE